MSDLPEVWPPPLSSAPVPLFPLAEVFLYPRQPLPMHIFEPRYIKLIEDSLDGPGRFVLGTIVSSEPDKPGYDPKCHTVAGIGEIARHDKLDDGRYMIVLFGLARVKIEEVPSTEPYRQVTVEPIVEVPAENERAEILDERIRTALRERTEEDLELPDEVPLEVLIDLLCTHFPMNSDRMAPIYAERDVARRAELALGVHAG